MRVSGRRVERRGRPHRLAGGRADLLLAVERAPVDARELRVRRHPPRHLFAIAAGGHWALRLVAYYEVTLIRGARDIQVGLCGERDAYVALHPNGAIFTYSGGDNAPRLRETEIELADGDVVGCGVNYRRGVIFWTLNGATLSTKLRTDGTELRAAFGEAAGDVAKACTVNIYAGSKFTGLGTVISSDGIVVAKNSEIDVADPGALRIVGPGKRIGRTRILARDIAHDLVFLDLGREVDPGYEWGDITALDHGTWVVAGVAGSSSGPSVRGGVCSAITREIKKAGGVIGVILGGKDGKEFGGVEVTEVAKEGPAEKAGVKKGDVIFAVDGQKVFERAKMIEKVKSHDPGTAIKVTLKRKDKEMELEITLGYRQQVFSELKNRNDRMSGKVSVRRTGFKRVIQHEVSLGPLDMGGPLFDLEGRLIGINIAKANRVEFFAIPVSDIRAILEDKAREISEARGE